MDALPFVLLDDSLSPDGSSFFFSNPEELIVCVSPEEVGPALSRISDAVENGYHAAGFFSYELGYLLEPKLAALLQEDRAQPLIWMGLFKERERWSEAQVYDFVGGLAGDDDETGRIKDITLSMERDEYIEAFQKAQDYISAGDVYQINLTLKILFSFGGNPYALYRELRRKQKVAYGGIISAPGFQILSLSPELFFRLKDGTISSRPMKGTAPRGLTPETDEKIANWLSTDEKSRAENLMIVDLLRNDLGRISKIGSVHVTDLFTVENYRTVLQMTSGISAKLENGKTIEDIIRAIFPCGSVTGAPKVRAMEIIRELETAPRGIYTGSMGMISPGQEAAFNVAIRTLVLNDDGSAEMGIGSGVVADSEAQAEFDECLLKAHFLTEPYPAFQLIETLRYEQGQGYYLLDRHLGRLAKSAKHFGFTFDKDDVVAALEAEATKLQTTVHMVRLLLDERGGLTTSNIAIELPGPDTIWRFALSDQPLDQEDIGFYHKTTRRAFYTAEFDRYHEQFGTEDVVFLNMKGELTEGSRTNIFLQKDGELLTPPVDSGLLPGTLREELLADSEKNIKETRLYLKDLLGADKIYLGNSVRGLVEARCVNCPSS